MVNLMTNELLAEMTIHRAYIPWPYEDPSSKGLVTNYGEGEGATKREGGGACEVLPLRKGGGEAEQVLAMLKGGGNNNFRVVFTW